MTHDVLTTTGKWAGWAARAVCLCLLASCAADMPSRSVQGLVDTPKAWSTETYALTNNSTDLSRWWLRFDDVGLSRLVADALVANTSIAGARAVLLQARALRDVAQAGLSPTLSYSVSAQRSTLGVSPSASNYRTGIDGSWDLDLFGARQSALDASDASAQAATASFEGVQAAMATEVALAYISLRAAQARLVIANNNLASQLDTLAIVQWRLQAGLVGAVEVAQARGAAELTRAQLPVLQSGIDKFGHALGVLTGQPPAGLAVQLRAIGKIPVAVDSLGVAMPDTVLRLRPEVRAAQYQVAKAAAQIAQANAQNAPVVKLGATVGLAAPALENLAQSEASLSAVTVSVVVPLFDAGGAKAQVRAQQAALDQARANYKAAALSALKDVEDAMAALRSDRERLARLQSASQSATEAALLARQRYSSGLVDFQVVLETQRTQLGTQDSVASATADLSADQVRLYSALGGGWSDSTSEIFELQSQ